MVTRRDFERRKSDHKLPYCNDDDNNDNNNIFLVSLVKQPKLLLISPSVVKFKTRYNEWRGARFEGEVTTTFMPFMAIQI